MSITNYWPLAASVIAPNLGGMVNGYITRQNIDSWYKVSYEYDKNKLARSQSIDLQSSIGHTKLEFT